MDDATRARLEAFRTWLAMCGHREHEDDLGALLAAYDAMLAERAQHQCPQYRQHHHSRLLQLRRTIAERDDLKAALVSECEVAQNTARLVREERERAEAAEAERDQARFAAQANADTANLNRQEIERLEAERDDAVAECDTYQRRWQAEYLAATAAQAQAAPVLAAADEVLTLRPLGGAHTIDVVVRQNGYDTRYQADWLKPLQAAIAAWRAAREG